MNLYLALLVGAVIVGLVPGYKLRKQHYLWSIADLAWVCAAGFSAYFAIVGLGKLSTAAERAFAVEMLNSERNSMRLSAYTLERSSCALTAPAKTAPSMDQQSFCETIRQVLFFSSLPRFRGLDAAHLAKQVAAHQGKYFPDGSFNVLGALTEYARIYAMRKDLLETNPFQDIADATDRVTKWLVALALLLILRSGRTYAEMFRRWKKE